MAMKFMRKLPAPLFLICMIACSFALAQQDDGVRGAQGTVVNGRAVSGSVPGLSGTTEEATEKLDLQMILGRARIPVVP
jgi:hypothetical protein